MYFLGDLHGSFTHLLYTLTRLKKKGINIIQVGDFGIGFNNEEQELKNLDYINQALIEWDAKLYVIRGNHDDPKYFRGELKDKLNTYYSNIYFIEDYEVLEIEDKKIVCIGGGVSIDRTYRTENKSYWKDEVVVYDPKKIKDIVDNNDTIDIIVTHSAPMWCHPSGIDAPIVREYCSVDKGLREDLIEERDKLSDIFDELNSKFKFKYHFYGHFHKNFRKKVVDTNHILLGIGDLLDLNKLIELDQEQENKLYKEKDEINKDSDNKN